MLTRFTKPSLTFFAAGQLFLLSHCGVNLPPTSQRSQAGPLSGYFPAPSPSTVSDLEGSSEAGAADNDDQKNDKQE